MKNIAIVLVILFFLASCNRDKILYSSETHYISNFGSFAIAKKDLIKISPDSVCVNGKCKKSDLWCKINCYKCDVIYSQDSIYYEVIMDSGNIQHFYIHNGENNSLKFSK